MPETPPRPHVAVVGGGLSGLAAADRLRRGGADVVVLEARGRVGGRAWSPAVGGVGPFDLGGAWHWEGQPRLPALAAELGLPRFRHDEGGLAVFEAGPGAPPEPFRWPVEPPPSWRLEGGAQGLALALQARLPDGAVRLGVTVEAVALGPSGVRLTGSVGGSGPAVDVAADAVVLALPPATASTLAFDPALSAPLASALQATPTWMGDSVKAVVAYPRAFWREAGLSGRALSHVGPAPHVHDASGPNGAPAALFGFLDPARARALGAGAADAFVAQLVRLFGPEAGRPLGVVVADWGRDPLTAPPAGTPPAGDHVPPSVRTLAAGPGGAWAGRLAFAGAETDPGPWGLLEGALGAGHRAAERVLAALRRS